LSVLDNTQVSHSDSNHPRSESDLAVDPTNPKNLVGASKKFDDPQLYHFHISPFFSTDGGVTWHESTLPMLSEWQGMTDPTVAFDTQGYAYLVGEPSQYNPAYTGHGDDFVGQGMVVYRSTDKGQTWKLVTRLSTSSQDDKQWVTADDRLGSLYHGRIYAIWGANQDCGFAVSADGGNTWTGHAGSGSSDHLANFWVYAPAITTDSKGWIHIFNITPTSDTEVQYRRSQDGGRNFELSKAVVSGGKGAVVSGVKGLEVFPSPDGFPQLPNGHFRVRTMVTATTGNEQTVMVAWPDTRQTHQGKPISRIYYRISRDGGDNWEGPDNGQALPLPIPLNADDHCIMPQLAATADGIIGCTFYVFGQEPGSGLFRLNVYLVASYDDGWSFPYMCQVSQKGWDPDVDAPWSHSDPNQLFIGDYFGLVATNEMFVPFWTDTRTGVQEIFSARVKIVKPEYVYINLPDLWHRVPMPLIVEDRGSLVLDPHGPIENGYRFVIIGDRFIRIPAESPFFKLIETIGKIEEVRALSGSTALRLQRETVMELTRQIQTLHAHVVE
jgi:hypothetical protein